MVPSSSPPTLQHRWILFAWMLIAALPMAYIAWQAAIFSRNIVFWDEFDTALDLILRIDAGASASELLQRFFAINNEHRMVTSRLLFASSYWLTGTINFHVIGAIGNLFLLAAYAILVWGTPGAAGRIRMGVVLAFLLFQLEHFENFLWSGASIDHFQVIMLTVGAIVAVHHGSPRALVLGAFLALLATFTLAHGTLAWPVCGALLAQQKRWRHLAIWVACTIAAAAAFLYGFQFNPGHQIEQPAKDYLQLLRYWLALLGGPLTLGEARHAPVFGVVLLAVFGLLTARRALVREPVAMFTAVFAIVSLALVAYGRAEIASAAELNSRYLVLGALAWAMVLFALLQLAAGSARPFRHLTWTLPALAVFNVSANARFAPIAAGFIEVRDRAATSFMQSGVDGSGITRLHPRDGHADVLLRMAAERGVYELPCVTEFASFPQATPSMRIIAHLDELIASDRAITIGGWGMIPDRWSRRGQVHVVLRSPKSFLVLTTVPLQRPDVAKAYNEPKWRWSGFRAVIKPKRLPAEDFELGVLLADDGEAEFIMTPHRLLLSGSTPRAVRGAVIP